MHNIHLVLMNNLLTMHEHRQAFQIVGQAGQACRPARFNPAITVFHPQDPRRHTAGHMQRVCKRHTRQPAHRRNRLVKPQMRPGQRAVGGLQSPADKGDVPAADRKPVLSE